MEVREFRELRRLCGPRLSLVVSTAVALALAAPATGQDRAAASDGPRYRVVGVAANDTLNVRQAPDPTAEVVMQLPPDASGLVATGETRRVGNALWRHVRAGDGAGWVNARFLEREADAPVIWNPSDVFYEDLACTTAGRGPGWRFNVSRAGAVTIEGDVCPQRQGLRAIRARPVRGGYLIEVLAGEGNACVSLQVRRTGACPLRGGSAADYELTSRAVDGRQRRGCCNPLLAEPPARTAKPD